MKGIKDFIIQIQKPYSETIKTEGGLEIYGDKRFSADKLTNRIGVIISSPVFHETEIQPGYEVLVDPTILYEQVYHLTGGRQDSIFLVDKEKSYYKVDPALIVLFRVSENSEWKGYLENGIYEKVIDHTPQEKLKSDIIFIPESSTPKYKMGMAVLKYGNESILESIQPGQEVYVLDDFGIEYFIDGKTYLWYRNSDVLAAVNNN